MIFLAIGAYGRTATQADWESGKDFQKYCGPYFSIRDVKRIKADGYTEIHFLSTGTKQPIFKIDLR